MTSKKKLRKAGKKVSHLPGGILVDPLIKMAGDAQRFNAYVQAQVLTARADGFKDAVGLDTYASMMAVMRENQEARELISRWLRDSRPAECPDDSAFEAAFSAFINKQPAVFVKKSETASEVPQPTHAPASSRESLDAQQSDAVLAVSGP